MVHTLFPLFSFIAVESAFKMVAIQVLFNSISLCVTTLTDLKRWIVIELYFTINLNNLSGLLKCMTACNIKFINWPI